MPAREGQSWNLTIPQKIAIFTTLWEDYKDGGKLSWGIVSRVARNFGFGHKTVARFWDSMCRAMQAHLNDHGRESDFFVNIANFEGSLKGKVGRKPKHDRKEVRRLVAEVPFSQRGDWRTLSSAVGIPKSTLHRMQKSEGVFKRQSNALKPSLTEANKLRRLQFARTEVNRPEVGLRGDPTSITI